jgi:glycosyltransferase involved in cell wall biosynthesis
VDERTASIGASAPGTITACIIARDEAEHLPDCLASVSICQEIVLVDSGSSDETVEIATAAGASVVEEQWRGFAAQRNVALDHAHCEWVLEVDADERISPALAAEIEAFVAVAPPHVRLGGLPLREVFLGHRLGPSGKYPKYRHRLLRRGAYRHDESRTVHEGLVPDGEVHPFSGELVHLLATSWGEAVGDAWRYARLEAGQLRARRTPAAVLKGAFVRPAAKLLYRLVVDGGWRDGWAGAAKIAIDCGTDSVVWLRYATGRHGHERGDSGVQESLHYGAWKVRRGCLRVLGVAAGASASAEASRWLSAASAAGADVALISTEPDAGSSAGVRVRRVARLGPLTLIRALDAEEQLRPLDAVVGFGRRATLLLHVVPAGLHGHMPELGAEVDPEDVRWDRREGEAVPA